MAEKIPVFQNKSSKFRQDLVVGGISLTMVLRWDTRAGYWFMSINDDNHELLNKKLVANWPIIRRSRASFPTLLGDFFLLKTDLEVGAEVDYDNLGNGWDLFFLDRFETLAWEQFYGA